MGLGAARGPAAENMTVGAPTRDAERRYSRSFFGVCQFDGSFGSITISTPLTMAVTMLHDSIVSPSMSYWWEITLKEPAGATPGGWETASLPALFGHQPSMSYCQHWLHLKGLYGGLHFTLALLLLFA